MNFNLLIMENVETINEMQNDILRIIGHIQVSKETQSRFMGIIGVIFGREHPDYKLFEDMLHNGETQLKMIQAEEYSKHRQLIQVFCHMALTDYKKLAAEGVAQEVAEGPQENIPQQDALLEHYFMEIENVSQHNFRLAPNKNIFSKLEKLEYSLLRRIFPRHDKNDPVIETQFTKGNYRQLLSVWLMYPQCILSLNDAQKLIDMCKTGTIKI